MAFNLANLFVSIKADDDPLQKQIGGVRAQLSSVGVAIGTAAGNLLSSAIAASASALKNFIGSAITGSMELQDTMGAVGATMGSAAPKIFSFVDDIAAKYGVVKTESMSAALSFSQIFKSAGKSADEAADMGTSLTKLGLDLARFRGGSYEQAFQAIQGSLQGNFQGNLDRYNIFLTMAEVNQRAVAMGLAKTTDEVSDNAKKLATLNLIMEKSVDMQGQMEREADQAGAQWAKATGSWQNASEALGTSLLPAITAVTQGAADLVSRIASSFESNKETIASWGESFAATIRGIPQYWDEFQAGIGVAFLKVVEFATNSGAYFEAFVGNAALIAGYIANNWREMIVDAVSAVGTAFSNLASNLSSLATAIFEFLSDPTGGFNFEWRPILEGFKATAGELPGLLEPNLISMDDAINAVGEDLARKTEARQQAAQAASHPAAAAKQAAASAAAKQDKFKSQTFDSEDFYYKLRESALGGDDTPKKQLEAQQKIAESTAKTAELLGGGALVARLG